MVGLLGLLLISGRLNSRIAFITVFPAVSDQTDATDDVLRK